MSRLVDDVIAALGDAVAAIPTRNKLAAYIDLLASTGKRDREELIALGLAYVRETIDGLDVRFSGW